MRPRKIILFMLALVMLAGCQSGDFNHYISPEVTGRVLAADTLQPIANVQVQRTAPDDFAPFGAPKGGQLLTRPAPVRTDAAGRFLLESKSVFSPFRSPGWWLTPVIFQCAGYETFQTNCTAGNGASRTGGGVPVMDVGEVFLRPKSR